MNVGEIVTLRMVRKCHFVEGLSKIAMYGHIQILLE